MFLINYDGHEYEVSKEEDLEEVPTAALLHEYNQLTGKATSKFASRAKGIEQIWPLISEATATPNSSVRKQTGGKRSAPIPKDSMIRILVDENPKTEGSKSYDRFELYHDGMTVGQYLELGGRRADLAYDADKEFITIELNS